MSHNNTLTEIFHSLPHRHEILQSIFLVEEEYHSDISKSLLTRLPQVLWSCSETAVNSIQRRDITKLLRQKTAQSQHFPNQFICKSMTLYHSNVMDLQQQPYTVKSFTTTSVYPGPGKEMKRGGARCTCTPPPLLPHAATTCSYQSGLSNFFPGQYGRPRRKQR